MVRTSILCNVYLTGLLNLTQAKYYEIESEKDDIDEYYSREINKENIYVRAELVDLAEKQKHNMTRTTKKLA